MNVFLIIAIVLIGVSTVIILEAIIDYKFDTGRPIYTMFSVLNFINLLAIAT